MAGLSNVFQYFWRRSVSNDWNAPLDIFRMKNFNMKEPCGLQGKLIAREPVIGQNWKESFQNKWKQIDLGDEGRLNFYKRFPTTPCQLIACWLSFHIDYYSGSDSTCYTTPTMALVLDSDARLSGCAFTINFSSSLMYEKALRYNCPAVRNTCTT